MKSRTIVLVLCLFIVLGYVEFSRNEIVSLNNRGLSLIESSKYDEAIECFDSGIELNPLHESTWVHKNLVLDKLSRLLEKILYNEALWNNRGNAFLCLGEYEEAARCYDRSIEIEPQNATNWCNKGSVLFYLGRYEESNECYNKAIEIDPQNIAIRNDKERALKARRSG